MTDANKMTMFDQALTASSVSGREPPEETPPRGLSVLVVDDDALTRTMMQRLLQRLGCDVTLAENGKLAVQMINGPEIATPMSEKSNMSRSNGNTISDHASTDGDPISRKFHVVFMDNQMPVMSGMQAVRFLRNQGRRDFIVGLTGNALLPGKFALLLRILIRRLVRMDLRPNRVPRSRRRSVSISAICMAA